MLLMICLIGCLVLYLGLLVACGLVKVCKFGYCLRRFGLFLLLVFVLFVGFIGLILGLVLVLLCIVFLV